MRPGSVFSRLEEAGVLEHRVGPAVAPGAEAEPSVPETATHATARARFIREHAASKELQVGWSWVQDTSSGKVRKLQDPFAKDYGPWEARRSDMPPPG